MRGESLSVQRELTLFTMRNDVDGVILHWWQQSIPLDVPYQFVFNCICCFKHVCMFYVKFITIIVIIVVSLFLFFSLCVFVIIISSDLDRTLNLNNLCVAVDY